jgi:phage protein D
MALPSAESAPDFAAPNFAVKVNGTEVTGGVRSIIQDVEFESAESIADLVRLRALDPPQQGRMLLRDSKVFQPGNTLAIAAGYGSQVRHLGGGIIKKIRPSYPRAGIPTMEVIAYAKEVDMADNSPEQSSNQRAGKGGRRWADSRYSDAVLDKATDYGMLDDVDDTPEEPHDFIQKVGLTDLDFVVGLSNLTGFLFWTDMDEDGKWTLHFKNPDTIDAADVQEFEYKFRYNDGDLSTLFSFEPELAITGATIKMKVQLKDVQTGRLIEVELEEDNDQSPDVLAEFGIGGDPLLPAGVGVSDNALEGGHTTGSDVKLFIDDFSFDIHTNRKFKYGEEELESWARAWFRRNRENFVLGRGLTIGLESLRARQTHVLENLGEGLSGRYYFSRVLHRIGRTGYECDFNARRVVPPVAAPIVTQR